MIDLLAMKSRYGDVSINKAKQHLARHGWGLAHMVLEEGISKGGLNDLDEVQSLLDEIRLRLWNRPV